MNIDIKFTVDEIKYIQQLIAIMRNFIIISTSKKEQLFMFSIVLDIGYKIDKRAGTLAETYGIVNRKKYKIKLKYHETVILEKFLDDILKNETDPYKVNMGRSVIAQLNQKLA